MIRIIIKLIVEKYFLCFNNKHSLGQKKGIRYRTKLSNLILLSILDKYVSSIEFDSSGIVEKLLEFLFFSSSFLINQHIYHIYW